MSRNKVQYGNSSDFSEGLMAEIQKLISPPDEPPRTTVKRTHPYYRRAGRQNHDSCDACNEPGNLLICCDQCPSSFHLQCHDPPLSEGEIPAGLWLCHNCRMKKKLEEEQKEILPKMPAVASNSGILSKQTSKTDSSTNASPSESPAPDIQNTNSQSMSRKSSESMKIEETVETEEIAMEKELSETDEPIELAKALTPFEELIQAASLLNPRQFELPREMNQTFPFPGSERIEPMRNGRRVKSKRVFDVDSAGLVPLPAKLCFMCRKSCKKAPLIACDYCTSLFHQDCLDPPLTALPAGLWMCPNHPEHFIDWNLVKSSSATERVKIWNEYQAPIDHEVVKLQFFRKVHTKNPPFRIKSKPKLRDEVEVPEIIRYQYENPPSLLPSLRDVLRCDNIMKRGTDPVDFRKRIAQARDEADEQLGAIDVARKKLKNIFSDQEDIHGLMEEDEVESTDDNTTVVEETVIASPVKTDIEVDEIKIKEEIPVENGIIPQVTTEVIENTNIFQDTNETDIKMEVDDVPKEVEQGDGEVRSQDSVQSLLCEEKMEPELTQRLQGKTYALNALELAAIDKELLNLDVDVIRLLAHQRLQQIVNENPDLIQQFQNKETASKTITELARRDYSIPMPKPVLENGHHSVDEDVKHDTTFVKIREVPFNIRNEDEKAQTLAVSLQNPINRSQIRSRAVMTFANDYLSGHVWFTVSPSLDKSTYMRYRSFKIGYGAANELDLSRYGSCAFVSAKHAVIFYDEITKQFELLNYSDFGTEVNGQLFSCDFTEHYQACESQIAQVKEKRVAIQLKIKNMIDAKRKIRETMDATKRNCEVVMAAQEPTQCGCSGRSPMIAGWEGTALLQHGFLIKFGCMSFVFSVAEYDSGNDSG
ncbi:unnamed protein product [Diamesa serratosioi]